MKNTCQYFLLIFLFFSSFCLAQTKNVSEIKFTSDNGYEGVASFETTNYFENTYKLKINLLEVQITGYKTSIGFFSGKDLASYDVTFPINCNDCSFSFEAVADAYFSHKNKNLQIPIRTVNRLSADANLIFSVPFEIPDTSNNYANAIADWEQSGALLNLEIKNLEGAIVRQLNNTLRSYAKAQSDQIKLKELLTDLKSFDRTKKLQRLYQNRSQFYNKTSIDSVIGLVKNIKHNSAKEPILVAQSENINTVIAEEKSNEIGIDDPTINTNLIASTIQNKVIPEQEIEISAIENEKAKVQALEKVIQKPEPQPVLSEIVSNPIDDSSVAAVDLSSLTAEAPSTSLTTIAKKENLSKPQDEPKKSRKKKPKKLSKLAANDFSFTSDLSKYKRSSLHTIMLKNPNAEQANTIEETFLNRPLPEKFNSHSITTNFISVAKKKRKQDKIITTYLSNKNIARALVSKWFNRNERGEFNMKLVANRGHYNASVFDLNLARKSERGLAMLADAGEQLIANTFVVVNDYKYTNKEEVAKKTGFLTSLVSVVANAAGAGDVAMIADAATITTGVMGKGYVVKVTSYLYRLKWNENIANTFYNDFWIDANNYDEQKKRAFETTELFELELLGYETDFSATQSTTFTSKTNAELIERATIKATDQTIAKLQRKFQIFRTMTPLISTEPLAAKIGLKEGLEKGDKFEVLEQQLNEDGTIGFNRVGTIKVNKNRIWDNRYIAAYEENNSSLEHTSFTGGKDKFYQGMLIRQIN